MTEKQKKITMFLFQQQCYDFWKREGLSDYDAFSNSIKDCANVKYNPFSPNGEPIETEIVQKVLDTAALKFWVDRDNNKLYELLISYVEKYGYDCDEYYIEEWGLDGVYDKGEVKKCLEVANVYTYSVGKKEPFGFEYESVATLGIYVVQREGYAKTLECYGFYNSGREYDDSISEPYHDPLTDHDFEYIVEAIFEHENDVAGIYA